MAILIIISWTSIILHLTANSDLVHTHKLVAVWMCTSQILLTMNSIFYIFLAFLDLDKFLKRHLASVSNYYFKPSFGLDRNVSSIGKFLRELCTMYFKERYFNFKPTFTLSNWNAEAYISFGLSLASLASLESLHFHTITKNHETHLDAVCRYHPCRLLHLWNPIPLSFSYRILFAPFAHPTTGSCLMRLTAKI